MKSKILIITCLFVSFNSFALLGLGGPSKKEKSQVQKAMKSFVKSQVKADGLMPVIFKGKVLRLKVASSKKYPDGFHSGVKQEGNLYASCADFIDPITKDKYDVDFIVNNIDGEYRVVQPLVHSKNGDKDPYHLKH